MTPRIEEKEQPCVAFKILESNYVETKKTVDVHTTQIAEIQNWKSKREETFSSVLISLEDLKKKVDENVKLNARYGVIIGLFTAILTATAVKLFS
jgi:sorbitol-specific phosphotransferase system component IIBC